MNIQDSANLLAQKINYESSIGSEIPLEEYLTNVDDSETFEREANQIIDVENIELEGFVSGLKTVIAKLIEGFLWLMEKITSFLSNLIKAFSVTKQRINSIINRLSDLKSTTPTFKVSVEGWSGLTVEKLTAAGVLDKISSLLAFFISINKDWPGKRDILYKNLQDLLTYGRETKNVDHIISTINSAAKTFSIAESHPEVAKLLHIIKGKTVYEWKSHAELLAVANATKSLYEEVDRYSGVLRDHTRKSFALKNKLKSYLTNYGPLDKKTAFDEGVKDALAVYTHSTRESFKVIKEYGFTYLNKVISHLNEVIKKANKAE